MASETPKVPEIDGFVHEPARLRLLVALSALTRADFTYLLNHTGLSRGNLSVQMSNLSDAGYVSITKEMAGNRPRTSYAITRQGRTALARYRDAMLELFEEMDH